MDERITIEAKRIKPYKNLTGVFGNLGFTKMQMEGENLIVEKTKTEGLAGKNVLDYRIVFSKDKIEFFYRVSDSKSMDSRHLELFPLLLNALQLAEGVYSISSSSIFPIFQVLLERFGKIMGKDSSNLSSALEELKLKYADMSKKYEELLRSSEENARILLECERRRDELQRRVLQLERTSNEELDEELYNWIKLHGGSIEVSDFCSDHRIERARAEEGLERLMKGGYIKKRE